LTIGDNPSSVNVVGGKRNDAGLDGYVIAQNPQPTTGEVYGIVYQDANGNGQRDNGENGISGIVVSVLDANGDTKRASTNASGEYSIQGVAVGSATVTVQASTLPANSNLTVGDNPSSVNVVGGSRNDAGLDGYVIAQNPQPTTGKVCGIVYFDENKNGKQDKDEDGSKSIIVSILDAQGQTQRVEVGEYGYYCVSNVAVGEATVTVQESTLPTSTTLTIGDNPSVVNVVGGQKNDAGKDGYILMLGTTTD
jgi:hypothetical protein